MEQRCEDYFAKTCGNDSAAQYEELAACYPERSCLFFTKRSPVRKCCILIINSKLFEKFILFIILCNCITLALSSTRQDFSSTGLGKALAGFDYLYIAIFTAEMMLKTIAMGFLFGNGSYLRDGWNVLDFLVVVMGYVSLLSPSNLTAIRAFRAMRPLRTINRVKGMKVLVNTMIDSLPLLLDVFLLCAFTFFLFSLVAVQLFAGVLKNRCGTPDFSGAYNATLASSSSSDTGVGGSGLDAWAAGTVVLANVSYEVPDDQSEDMCSGPLSSEVVWYLVNGKPVAEPGSKYAGRHCNGGMYCAPYGNPYDGLVSYDNILWSWLTIFQHITLSGWSDVMYMVMDAVNYWVWIFYVGLIIFGAFFMVNLALAVLAVNFSMEEKVEEEEEEEEQQARQRQQQLQEQEKREEEGVLKTAEHRSAGQRSLGAAAMGIMRLGAGGISTTSRLIAALKARRRAAGDDEDAVLAGSDPPPDLGRLRRLVWPVAVSKGLELTTAALILLNTVVMCVNWYGMPYKVEQVTNYINYVLTVYFAVDVAIRLTAFGFARFFRVGMNVFDFIVVVLSLVEMIVDLLPSVAGVGPLSVLRAFRLLRIFRLARHWRELNALLTGMFKSVQASIMLVALMLLFLFVAALVGMQVFGYRFMFCDYVEGAIAVCPPGQRVWGDCPNHFYCYLPCSDSQNGTWVDAPGSFYNGLAYCERFCASAEEAGCEYLAMVGKSQVPRANFDNVLWGLYSVFQVLTGENWNDILVDAMRAVSPWASLYFVGVILIGNYLVFNLFIAILLDNLNSKMEQAAALTAAPSFIASSKHGKKLPAAASRQPSAHRAASAAVAAPSQLGLEVTDGDAMAASSTCNDAGGRDDGKDGGGDVVGGGNRNMVVENDGSRSHLNSRVARASAPRISMMLPEYHVEGWRWDERSLERPQGSDMESRAGDADAVKSLGQQQQQEHSCKPCLPFERGSVRGMVNELGFAVPVTRRLSGGGSLGGASTTSTQSSGLRMPLPPFYGGVTTAAAAATAADRPYSASATHTPVRLQPSAVAASPGSFAHSPWITSAVPSSPQLAPRTGGPLAESVEVPETTSASGHGSRTGDGGGGNGVGGKCGGNVGDSRAGGSGGGVSGSCSAVAAELLRRHGGPSSPLPLRPLPASVLSSSVRRHDSSSSRPPQHPPPLSSSPDDVATATAAETTIAKASSGCSGSDSDIVHPLVSNGTVSRPSNSNDMSRTDLMTKTEHRQTHRLKPRNPSQRSLAFILPPVASTVDSVQQQQQQRGSSLLSSQASFRAVTETFRNMLYSFSSFRAPLSRTTSASSIGSAGPFWEDALEGRSLLLFGHNSRLRHATAELVHNPFFEMIILLLILASCVSLVLNSPGLDPDSRMAKALQILDYIFTGAFTLEAILKIVTFGFAFTGKHAYIRSGWNVLDFLIVLLGWALIVVEIVGHGNAESLKVLRVLRALRALRPLRAVHRFAGLRVVVDTLFAVLPSMINVALVCAFFYLIFAILAVNLFKGKLFNCIDAASGARIDPYYVLPPGQVLTRSWCEAGTQTISQSVYYSSRNLSRPMPEYTMVMQWVNPKANFDNVGAAMLALFQTATLSLWVDITFSAVDAVGVDKQPLWNHNPWVILFFVAFVVVCSFFVLNLFIGVTLDKFAELHQDQQTAGTFLTPQQQSWVKVQRLLLRSEVPYVPPRPPNRFRGVLYSFVSSRGFDVMMLVVILANVLFITMVHADMSAAWQAVMSYSNLVFTCIFVIEAALKMTAFGPRGYFHDSWNRFDFFVAAVSVVSVVLDFSDTRNLSFMPVLRVLRVVRVVRLVRQAKGMQKLLRTLITSLPALVNVGGVMLLIFFIFAVIGVNLFADIKHGDNLDSHANFDTFPNAMLLLFRMLTGEGWDAIMQDCMNMGGCVLVLQDFNVSAITTATTTASLQLPVNTNVTSPANSSTVISLLAGTYLDPSDPLLSSLPSNATQNQCPLSPVAAIVYFPTFVVLCTFILLQLVIAVLRENLIESDGDGDDGSEGGAARPVPRSAMESFTKAWRAAVVKAAKGGGGQKGGGSSRGLLHASQLPRVLEATQPPLGASGSPCPRQEVQKLLLRLRIPLYEGNKVSFMNTLHALASRVCATPLPPPEQDKLHRDLSKKLPRSQPHSKFTAAHYHAANSVAAAIRGFLLRHNLRDQLGIPVGPGGELNQEQRRQNQANQPQQQQQQPLNGGELRGRLVTGEIGGPSHSRSPSRSRAPHRLPSASSGSRRQPPIVSPNGAVVQRPGGISPVARDQPPRAERSI